MKNNILLIILISVSQLLNAQTITVIYPNGEEQFIKNTWSPHNITWESSGVSNVDIEYSDDNGANWYVIESNYLNENFYSWNVPDIQSALCFIRISDAGSAIYDDSDEAFFITAQNLFIAKWNTTMGVVRAELRGDLAPMTSQNFMNLAQKGFYTDLIFHRVIPNFMIQDGCPLGTGYGGPGYSFDDEFHPDLTHNYPGVLSMANSGANTNGSQYFITVDDEPGLNNSYSVFGRIIDGMDVVYAISEVDTDGSDKPLTDVNLTISIVESNPALTLQYPSEGLKIEKGRTINILWDSDFIPDSKIEFSSDNGSTWDFIIDSIPSGEESFAWTAPDVISTECIIKVTSLRDEMVVSENVFEIRENPVVISRLELYNNVVPADNNPENIISLGNTLRFKLKFKNQSLLDLTTFNVNLSCENPDLIIINSSILFPNLSQDANVWTEEEIEIQLPENFPNKGEYSFTLYGTTPDIDDDFWIGDFNLPVLSIFSFITVDDNMNDNSSGNNNHIIEAGETIELELPLQNKSSEILYDVYGQLRSNANYINVWNDIVGANGTVYDTTKYNDGNPIDPNSLSVQQENAFVFDYNETDTYQTDFMLVVTGFLNEEEGVVWDEGGIKMKWGISKMLNSTYPPASIDGVSLNNESFNILQNPASDYVSVSYDLDGFNNKLEVSDIQGRLIFSEVLNNESGTKQIDVSSLKNGLYFIRINNSVKKVIVLK